MFIFSRVAATFNSTFLLISRVESNNHCYLKHQVSNQEDFLTK